MSTFKIEDMVKLLAKMMGLHGEILTQFTVICKNQGAYGQAIYIPCMAAVYTSHVSSHLAGK